MCRKALPCAFCSFIEQIVSGRQLRARTVAGAVATSVGNSAQDPRPRVLSTTWGRQEDTKHKLANDLVC